MNVDKDCFPCFCTQQQNIGIWLRSSFFEIKLYQLIEFGNFNKHLLKCKSFLLRKVKNNMFN